jgi:nitrous oxidase accessory protein NosD
MPLARLLRHGTLLAAVTASVLVAAPAAQARTAHCGMRIKHDFTLHRNLRNCRGDGLVVVADNVTVNLRGHTIDGRRRRSSVGVRVTGVHGVTVRRGRIKQFGMGMLLVGTTHARILRNRISGSFDEGIFTDEASSHLFIAHNRINTSGIRSGALWADGIDARGDAVRVVSNAVWHNHDDGIDVNGTDLSVFGNLVVGNVHDGIDVDGHDALVRRNRSLRNGDDGVGVSRLATSVTIRDNVLVGNADLGVQPVAGTFVDGGGNRASGNGDTRQCVRVVCSR